MREEILKFSKQTKLDADEILQQTNIINILSEFGDVHIGGSYAFNLMYKPDIDIDVITSKPKESAIQCLNKIIDARIVQKLEFGDFEKFERVGRPKAFIIVLKIQKNDRKWEIEIWFKEAISEELASLNEKLKNLSEEQRNKILELKSEGKQGSIDIYKEVLEIKV
jgi:hypothetical protein